VQLQGATDLRTGRVLRAISTFMTAEAVIYNSISAAIYKHQTKEQSAS